MPKILILLLFIFTCIHCNASELQVSVIDNHNQPVEDIVVYVEVSVPQASNEARVEQTLTISQENKAFEPYISVIQKNQQVEFVNKDDITHHIFNASREHGFSFRIRSGNKKNDLKFNQNGQISMGCNIHDWMSGYLLVVDTPYFAKTNQQGQVNLSLTGEGQATVYIWHPQLAEDNNNTHQPINLSQSNQKLVFNLKNQLDPIPSQESGDDFDFLDDY